MQIPWSLQWNARCGCCDRIQPKAVFGGCSAQRWLSSQLEFPVRARHLSDRRHNQALFPSMLLKIYCHPNILSWKRICAISWGMDGNGWVIIPKQGCLEETGFWTGPTHWCPGETWLEMLAASPLASEEYKHKQQQIVLAGSRHWQGLINLSNNYRAGHWRLQKQILPSLKNVLVWWERQISRVIDQMIEFLGVSGAWE